MPMQGWLWLCIAQDQMGMESAWWGVVSAGATIARHCGEIGGRNLSRSDGCARKAAAAFCKPPVVYVGPHLR
jgi:hypothetical protein